MIYKKAMLVKLNISQWDGQKKDLKISKGTNLVHVIDHNPGHYVKMLIPKKAIKSIKKVANAARTFHYEYTLPWGERGERLLPAKSYMIYNHKMLEYKHSFEDTVNALIAEYTARVKNSQDLNTKMFNVSDPAQSMIAKKYNFSMEIAPVPTPIDFRVDIDQYEVIKIKQQIKQQTKVALTNAMANLWYRLYVVVKQMGQKLDSKDAIFRNSLVTNIQKLTKLVPDLNIADDARLDEINKEVKQKLCRYPALELRSNYQLKKDIAQEANSILGIIKVHMKTTRTKLETAA